MGEGVKKNCRGEAADVKSREFVRGSGKKLGLPP